MSDRLRGFKPLRPGCIHIRCPKCGRKLSNEPRMPEDHPEAALAEFHCPRCGVGGKSDEVSYYRADGTDIEFEDMARHSIV